MQEVSTAEIWMHFHEELYRFIRSRVKDEAISKDILQDIFEKIHLKLSTLADQSKLSAWLYQITRNSINDHFRKSKHESSSEIPEIATDDVEDIHRFEKCIEPHLKLLNKEDREAIRAIDLGDLSQKEYAEQLGLSYSGAKSRVQRARERLKDVFMECCTLEMDKYGNVIDAECVHCEDDCN